MAAPTSDACALSQSETSSQKRINWSLATTEALIRIWEDNLAALRSNTRNARIYRLMAEQVNSGLPAGEGPYTAKQVRQKWENLNKQYRKLRRCGTATGAKGIEWPFYWQLHSFLGSLPINDRDLVEESVEVPVAHSPTEGSEIIATCPGYAPVPVNNRLGQDESVSAEESPATVPDPMPVAEESTPVTSASSSKKRNRKRASSTVMSELLALHERAEERAAKSACESLELRRQLVELQKESNEIQRSMMEAMKKYFNSKQNDK